ncbi:Ig-like domain-containing protein [Pseudoalteromonas spongiae]|uniref:Ig-like domain-containing protein n=1 Tax=Pseudoalteromonas spongiae TaxID=298657 RepID=UPI000C2D57DD|nr:Ig-like domain-containing protein [Pseudoalteromonas spongiae]
MRYKLLLSSLLLSSNLAHSASITLTGTLVTKKPTYTIQSETDELVAHVKPMQLSANVNETNQFCTVTTDSNLAMQGANDTVKYCLFEWTGGSGLNFEDFSASGIPNIHGNYPVGYKISFFSGSSKEKVLIHSENDLLNVFNPQPPVITSYKVHIGDDWKENGSQKNHNPDFEVKGFEIEVEPRKYTQVVSVPDFSNCVVNAGQSSCFITMAPYKLGDPSVASGAIGEITHSFSVNSSNNYWTDSNIASDLLLTDWHYAQPKLLEMAAQAVVAGQEKHVSINAGGQEISVENGFAKATIGKPLESITGDWWLPKHVELKFQPDNGKMFIPRLSYEGTTLFRAPVIPRDQEVAIKNIAEPTIVNGEYVYTFDLTDVPDGIYDVTMVSTDNFGQSEEKVFEKGAHLSRTLPQLAMFKNFTEMRDEQNFYFARELLIGAYNGYENDTTITSVTFNGESIDVTPLGNGIAKIEASNLSVPAGRDYLVKIEAVDGFGNEVQKELNVRYAPMAFNVRTASRRKHELHRAIEMEYLIAEQTDGTRCRFYNDALTAQKYATGGRITCIFNWENLPDSFKINGSNRNPSVYGYVDNNQQEVNYKVTIYNEHGDTIDVLGEPYTIKTQEPTEIELSTRSRVNLINDMYPVQISGGEILRAQSISSPGSLDVEFEVKANSYLDSKNPSSRTGEEFFVATDLDLDSELNTSLWETVPVSVKASYKRLPEVNASQDVTALILPDSDISVAVDFQNDLILSTDAVTAKINLGKFNRRSGWSYDESSMGEWEVYLGRYDRKNLPTPITDIVKLDSDGTAYIEVPVADIGINGATLVAVAKAITPIANYEHIIQSPRSYFLVFKGEKIEGSISNGELKDKVPLIASLTYVPKERSDRAALGEVYWETSADGVNWNKDTASVGQLRWKRIYNQEEVQFVRVNATNKFTSEVTVSEALKIVAYEQPRLSVKQVNEVLTSEAAKFSLFDDGKPVSSADGVIEWSLDERETWISGDATEAFYKSELKGRNVYARMKYHGIASDSDVGDKSFTEARIRYSFLRAPRMYFEFTVPDSIEVGSTQELSVNAYTRIESMNSRVMGEWELPDKSIVQGDKASFTFDPEFKDGNYFYATYTAWVDGAKEESLSSSRVRINSWQYEFPDVSVNFPQTVQYAPSKMAVDVDIARHFAPGVTYDIEMEPSIGVSLIENQNERFVLGFNTPGIHPVSFNVTNSRGDSKRVSQYIEVLPPLPMSVDLVKTFSNEYMRFPLDIALRARAGLGHIDDRVKYYKWYLDDNLLRQTSSFRDTFSAIGVGNHSIRVEVETEFGQKGEASFDFEVVPNQKPIGEITLRETEIYFELTLRCSDADGKIVANSWELNGELLSHGHNVVELNKSKLPKSNSVIGRCYDDSYDFVELSETLLK